MKIPKKGNYQIYICKNAFEVIDEFEKIVITMDNNPLNNLENGYKMLNIYDFLLNENSLESI